MGNVSRAVSSNACCQDYVISSPSTSVVRVLFSADLPGVTFLADTPDEVVDVGGPGVDDVLLADLDGDDRIDLVALRSDGNIAVVRGIAGPPGGPFFDAASLDTFPAGAGAGAMTAADLDCDGDLDLAITAPSADAFVLLAGGGNGTFSIPLPRPAGSAPQDVATGDVDGDGDQDVAVSNDDGGFTISLNQCMGGFAAPVSYEIYPTATPSMPIAMGKLCPGHPNDMAVAVGIFDIVYLTCGDGSGSFANVAEPHGEQVVAPYDYFWDATFHGTVTEPRIADFATDWEWFMGQVHVHGPSGDWSCKMKRAWRLLPFAICVTTGPACGPQSPGEPGPDSAEIISEFCANLFRCPETEAMLNYDSIRDCESVHEEDYDRRDPTCQERVLMLEEWFSQLTCAEFDSSLDGGPCSEERAFLTERCHPL